MKRRNKLIFALYIKKYPNKVKKYKMTYIHIYYTNDDDTRYPRLIDRCENFSRHTRAPTNK